MSRGKVPRSEIRAVFSAEKIAEQFPPMLALKQLAALYQCSLSTVRKLSAEGELDFAKSTHRPVRFWRDYIVARHFGDRGK